MQDQQVRQSVGHPVVRVVCILLVVPPTEQRPILGMGGLREVAGAGLDLHADEQATVEPSGVTGLGEQVGPQVMLDVRDHRSPADTLESGSDLAGPDPTGLLLRRCPHHRSLVPWSPG
jgi:hypothetical protein